MVTSAETEAAMEYTDKRFRDALRDLILARGEPVTLNGNVDWPRFVETVPETSYETLRKAMAGERRPSESLIERVAQAVGVRPDYFFEYRLSQALRDFDVDEVGWEEAARNLAAWSESRPKHRKKRRGR